MWNTQRRSIPFASTRAPMRSSSQRGTSSSEGSLTGIHAYPPAWSLFSIRSARAIGLHVADIAMYGTHKSPVASHCFRPAYQGFYGIVYRPAEACGFGSPINLETCWQDPVVAVGVLRMKVVAKVRDRSACSTQRHQNLCKQPRPYRASKKPGE